MSQETAELVRRGYEAWARGDMELLAALRKSPKKFSSLLMPAHCTGWRAIHRLATRLPNAVVISTVGTTIAL